MKRLAHAAHALTSQWPRVIAESLGLRAAAEMLPAEDALPDRERWESSRFGAVWLGHATALLRLGDCTVLTDPVFEQRVGIKVGSRRIGRLRSTALPADVDDLPPIDIVLLSHAHLDHWCRASLQRLARPHTVAVIPVRTRRLLPRGFGHVIELPEGNDLDLDGLHLTSIRPNHWGARYLVDQRRGCNAYLIEPDGPERNRTLFAGDTAHTDEFNVLAQRHPTDPARFPRQGVDLALLGIGGYRWPRSHCTPEQVADMARGMNAARIAPIHHATFRDTSEPIDEPLARLCAAWDPDRIVCAHVGQAWFSDDAA